MQRFVAGDRVWLTEAALKYADEDHNYFDGMQEGLKGTVVDVDMGDENGLHYHVVLDNGIRYWFRDQALEHVAPDQYALQVGDRVRLNEKVEQVAFADYNNFEGLAPGLEGTVTNIDYVHPVLIYQVALDNGECWWFRESVLDKIDPPQEKEEEQEELTVTEVYSARVDGLTFQRAAQSNLVEILRRGECLAVLSVQQFKDVGKVLRV